MAQRQYLWRHNNALKWVLSELLIAYKFREKHLPLRQESHSNDNDADVVVEILWDCTVSTARRLEEEVNRPDLVVTDRGGKVINVIEMACPSWRNWRQTNTRKTEKYRTVRIELWKETTVSESKRGTLYVLEGYDRNVKNDLNSFPGRSNTNNVLKGPSQPHLCFCLYTIV